ncbi:MAG TPA: META domain-containing protein, partial [Acidimicrobiia bacterium]
MRRITFLSALAVLAVACLGSDFAASVEGAWQLTSGTVDGEAIPILESHPITIEFGDGQVGGTAACNGYGGTYELSGATLSMSDLAMTEMACSPDEVMEAEALYASALILVDHVEVNADLTLTGPGTELVFEMLEPVPDAELTNTVWVLDSLIMGDAVSS